MTTLMKKKTKIEQIESFLENINLDNLSLTDLKLYTEIAISIDQHNTNKELLTKFQEKGDRVVSIPMV